MQPTQSKRATVDTNNPSDEKISAFGAFTFLYMRSELHQHMQVPLIRQSLEPPVTLGFYKIIKDQQGVPRAGITWAQISDEAQQAILNQEPLQPIQWASGPNLWVMEIVAPFGQRSGARAMHWLRHEIPIRNARVNYMRADIKTRSVRFVQCDRGPKGRLGATIIAKQKMKER